MSGSLEVNTSCSAFTRKAESEGEEGQGEMKYFCFLWSNGCFWDAALSNTCRLTGREVVGVHAFPVLSSFLAQAQFRQMVRRVLWERIPPFLRLQHTHIHTHMHEHNNAGGVPQELTLQLWHLPIMKHHSIVLVNAASHLTTYNFKRLSADLQSSIKAPHNQLHTLADPKGSKKRPLDCFSFKREGLLLCRDAMSVNCTVIWPTFIQWQCTRQDFWLVTSCVQRFPASVSISDTKIWFGQTVSVLG